MAKNSTVVVAGKGHVSMSRQVTAADLKVNNRDGLVVIDAQSGERISNAQIPSAPHSQPIEASVSILNPEANAAAPNTDVSNGSSQLEQETVGDSGRAMAKEESGHELLKEQASMAADRVSERAISVMPEVDCESANLQSNHPADTESGIFFTSDERSATHTRHYPQPKDAGRMPSAASTNGKRRSPDGQGGSPADILER